MNPARNSNSQSLLISKDADTDAADRRPDLFEHAPTAYLVVSECGILLEANCQAGILLRAGRSSILRQPVAQLIRPEDHSAFQNYCSRLTSSSHSSQPLSCELRMIRADGSWFRATLSSTKYHSENECLILISLRDAGNRSEAEAALEESQTRTRLLMHAANLALWDWNLLTDEVYFSPEWKHQLGYTDDEFPNNFNEWKNRLHPADLERTLQAIGDYRAGRRSVYDVEFRMQHKDGSWRWIFSRADFARNDAGEPVRMMGCHFDITERRQAEDDLRESTKRFRTLLDELPVGILLQSTTSEIVKSNPQALALLGLSIDQLHGKTSLDPDWNVIHEDGTPFPGTEHPVPRAIATGLPVRDAVMGVFRPATQDRVWLLVNAIPLRDVHGVMQNIICTFADITDRRKAETALRESERRLREAQAISRIGNFHWDANTNKVSWSDELYRIYGHVPGQFEPTFDSYIAAIHQDDRNAVLTALQSAMASHSCFDHQYRVLLPNGELRWVHARGNCIAGQDGQLTDLDGTCQDITEQKKNEAIQASLESQLRESQKMEAIGTLAGGIAHDFNNILAAILGNVEIAIDESRDASPIVTRCLEDTLKAGFRARNLVQQILSFSRRQPTDRRLLAPGPVIAETVKLLRATLPARLTLEVNLADDVPPVMADATQLEQVLINLATNALHAVKGQAGRLRICLDSVAVTDTLAAARPELQGRFPEIAVRLTISDTGYGMDAATRQRIFEPFFTTKAVDEGTGLGLAVVHGIVQRHDGVILVDSQPGEGTTFTIYLPAASVQPGPAADQQSGSQVSVNPQQTAVLTSPLHVLYLDDDTSVLFMVRQLFERKGYRVSCFSDQNEALDAVRRSPSEFSIVVTDYNMPGMQGTDVAREVRLIRPDLPVAVTSGFIDEELLAEADQCGVKRLISKPFELELFFCEIQRLALSSAENLQASDYSG